MKARTSWAQPHVDQPTVVVERRGSVTCVTLNRPPLNVLTLPMLFELSKALTAVERDPDVGALILTGAGKAFCAGVDVADHTADRVDEMLRILHEVFDSLVGLPVPVVAAVNGAALGGGCELMLGCDVAIAQAGAKIGLPEVRLGVFPPLAAVYLPRLLGRQQALDLILSGRMISALEARDIGLVTRVVPEVDFEDEVAAYAERWATLSGPVLRLAKRAVVEGLEQPARKAVRRAEALYRDDLMRLEDPHEGVAAFLEKRDPVWRGA